MNIVYNILKIKKMISIKNNSIINISRIALYLIISILIFISNSNNVFSKDLIKNNKKFIGPEEELAIRYCDSVNKNIFNGLDQEESLKYEYFFSSLKNPSNNSPKKFFNNFLFYANKRCSYKMSELDEQEFNSYIKKFLKSKL